MQKDSLYVLFQMAIERTKGGMNWSDIMSLIEKVRKNKMEEMLASVLSDMTIADCSMAMDIAREEWVKYTTPPPLPPPGIPHIPLTVAAPVAQTTKKKK